MVVSSNLTRPTNFRAAPAVTRAAPLVPQLNRTVAELGGADRVAFGRSKAARIGRAQGLGKKKPAEAGPN
jgi:hypothetical protein